MYPEVSSIKDKEKTKEQLTVVEVQFQNILKRESLVSWELWMSEARSSIYQERAELS